MRFGRAAMGCMYIAAGIAHFAVTRIYITAIPDYLPAPRALVLISGVAEIAGGLGVMLRQTKRAAAWGIIALLLAVSPANLWMAQHPDRYGIPAWALWLRVPLQLPLIWWAWRYTRQRPRIEA